MFFKTRRAGMGWSTASAVNMGEVNSEWHKWIREEERKESRKHIARQEAAPFWSLCCCWV